MKEKCSVRIVYVCAQSKIITQNEIVTSTYWILDVYHIVYVCVCVIFLKNGLLDCIAFTFHCQHQLNLPRTSIHMKIKWTESLEPIATTKSVYTYYNKAVVSHQDTRIILFPRMKWKAEATTANSKNRTYKMQMWASAVWRIASGYSQTPKKNQLHH